MSAQIFIIRKVFGSHLRRNANRLLTALHNQNKCYVRSTSYASCLTFQSRIQHSFTNLAASRRSGDMERNNRNVMTSSTGSGSEPVGAKLYIHPQSALVDDVIDIRVSNLPPLHDVTLACVLEEGGKVYVSSGQYVTGRDGTVDVAQSISLGGTYTGVERMGLLWSMQLSDDQLTGTRLIKYDVTTPFQIDLYVLDGHVSISNPKQLTGTGIKCLNSSKISRYYQDLKVRAVPVREGSIRGVFFIPSGDGPFPGVIDMFGTAGGIMKFRAALLASRGIATLALPYFDYEDLPKQMEIDYQYFMEAVDWLYKQPMINRSSGGIGVMAVSKGATLAMQMAIMSKRVKAVVAINGPCLHHSGVHTNNGEPQPIFTPTSDDFDNGFKKTDEGYVFGEVFRPTSVDQEAVVPIEQAPHCKFLFVVSEDDPSNVYEHVTVLIHRLLSHGLKNYKLLSYPGAGHLVEPPYTPHCRVAYAKLIGAPVLYGGQTKSHSAAQEDSWKEALSFFKQELNNCSRHANSKL